MKKIIALAPEGHFPGVTKDLKSGDELGFWEYIPYTRQTDVPKADIYIFGVFTPLKYRGLMNLRGEKWIRWTSSPSEMALEVSEIPKLFELVKSKDIDKVSFTTKSLAEAFDKGFYRPNLMNTDIKEPEVEKENKITLFCPTKRKKNIFSQLVATSLFQEEYDLILHTNIDSKFCKVMDKLGIRYEHHNWLQENEYLEMLASSKINLQCSLAESFNFQVMMASLAGTPSVVGPSIYWYLESLKVKDPNNASQIYEKMEYCLEEGESLNFKQRALNIADNNYSEARSILKEEMEGNI